MGSIQHVPSSLRERDEDPRCAECSNIVHTHLHLGVIKKWIQKVRVEERTCVDGLAKPGKLEKIIFGTWHKEMEKRQFIMFCWKQVLNLEDLKSNLTYKIMFHIFLLRGFDNVFLYELFDSFDFFLNNRSISVLFVFQGLPTTTVSPHYGLHCPLLITTRPCPTNLPTA